MNKTELKFKLIGICLIMIGLSEFVTYKLIDVNYKHFVKCFDSINDRLDAQSDAINAIGDGTKYLLKNAKLEEVKE